MAATVAADAAAVVRHWELASAAADDVEEEKRYEMKCVSSIEPKVMKWRFWFSRDMLRRRTVDDRPRVLRAALRPNPKRRQCFANIAAGSKLLPHQFKQRRSALEWVIFGLKWGGRQGLRSTRRRCFASYTVHDVVHRSIDCALIGHTQLEPLLQRIIDPYLGRPHQFSHAQALPARTSCGIVVQSRERICSYAVLVDAQGMSSGNKIMIGESALSAAI